MSEENDVIISVENMTAAYGETVVVDHISFKVKKGEVFVILGGSGCGKTTVMRQMIGLYTPVTGKILIDGDDMVTAEGKRRIDILRKIGVMYQLGALFGSLTLLENVRLPLEEYTDLPLPAMNLIATMKLKLVGLKGFENHMPSEISGGMQKRAAIARAMALDPKIIFLDEPSAGLDPITSAELDQLILALSRNLGMTVVIVTHELESIFTIADRVVMLDKETRGIIAEGAPQQLKDDPNNETVWRFFNRKPSMQTEWTREKTSTL